MVTDKYGYRCAYAEMNTVQKFLTLYSVLKQVKIDFQLNNESAAIIQAQD